MGLDSATDIAAEMGLSKGQVSKLAKKAAGLGLIKIVKRRYEAVDAIREREDLLKDIVNDVIEPGPTTC
jgi:predicted transcriptional regulator